MFGKQDFVDTKSTIYQQGKQWFDDMMNSKTMRKNFVEILTTIGKTIPNLKERLHQLSVPVLILWVGDDKTAKVSASYWLEKEVKKQELYILPGYRYMAPM